VKENEEYLPARDNDPEGSTRRTFLKTAGAGAAGALLGLALPGAMAQTEPRPPLRVDKARPQNLSGGGLVPQVRMASPRVLGANDRIRLGFIGIGRQGATHIRTMTRDGAENNTQSIAACDVYLPRTEAGGAAMRQADSSLQIQETQDYRRLLENPDIDAVVISSPEHWHAQHTIDALQAGKHVYLEKPMTRYLDEAFAIWDATKRTGLVVQIGSQTSSEPKWRIAADKIREGAIGPVVAAQGSYTRNSKIGEWNWDLVQDVGPHNLDWKMWLGTAPDRPWNEDARARFSRYRKYRDYSVGLISDLMSHKLHALMQAVSGAVPEFPSRVTTLATRNISTDREISDTAHVLAEFPSGYTLYILNSSVNEQGLEDMIRGHHATIRFGGDRVRISPERAYSEEVDQQEIPAPSGEVLGAHQRDWFESIRTGKTPNGNIDLGVRVQSVISMAEMSELHHKQVTLDAERRRISM
jgi:predicted dehydrogenase